MSGTLEVVGSPTSRTAQPVKDKRQQEKKAAAALSVTRISTFSELESISPEWHELHAVGGRWNPFASPDWLIPWAHYFVPQQDLAVFAVRRGDLLIGLAPCYYSRNRLMPRRLQLLGSGYYDGLTELPQVLTAPGEARNTMRALTATWCESFTEWDWIQVPVMSDQGWFEPEWLAGDVKKHSLIIHKTTRAAVVLDLPTEVSDLQKRLKPNLKESLRKSRSRLNQSGKPWEVSVLVGEDAVRGALPTFAKLHGARAHASGKRHHPDAFADPGRADFLNVVLPVMARAGRAQILSLNVDGTAVAMLIILLAPDCTYVYMSGFDPEWWHIGGVTFLQWHAAVGAIERRHEWLNMSVGPDVAKLRWSELIQQHPEFLVCGPRKLSKAKFTAYRMAAAVAAVRRESSRHRITDTDKGR